MKRITCLLFALHVAIALPWLASPAWAWDKKCDETRCATAIALANVESKTTLKIAIMQSKGNTSDVGLLLTAPLGVALEPGMRMLVQDKDLKIPFKVCFPDGCQAYLQLNADLLKTLTEAKKAQVQFFAQASSRALALDVDMSGLAEAVSKPG